MNHNYIIISPVRDEVKTIQLSLDSVLSQTVKPVKWVIIDDGSTDGTEKILDEYSKKHGCIHLVSRPFRPERVVGANIVYVLREGLELIKDLDWSYWVKLDADITFPEDHFEQLMQRFDKNPKLGIASGTPFIPLADGRLRLEWTPPHQAVGMSRMYRRECWQSIGDYAPRRHWDAIDIYTAQMRGWETKSFRELPIIHHRPIDAMQKKPLARRYDAGFGYYTAGFHPIYFLVRSIRAMFDEKPYVFSGISMYTGYMAAWVSRAKYYDPELRRFIYDKQGEMLRLINLWNYLQLRVHSQENQGISQSNAPEIDDR